MEELNRWGLQYASQEEQKLIAEGVVDEITAAIRPLLIEAVIAFLAAPLTATNFMQLELTLLSLVREFGRKLLQALVQSLETGGSGWTAPRDIEFECGLYRRRSDRGMNSGISTLFGNISLLRTGYRSLVAGEKAIFPIEMMLGLYHNVSPALLDLLGKTHASTGQSQAGTLEVIHQQCGVSMGVKRLRQCIESLAEGMEPLRQAAQVDQLMSALNEAICSKGSRKPVLAVGRDGITLRRHKVGCFEVATAATVSIYDRSGKRLKTVYLAYPPELGQVAMDGMLTNLLTEFFTRWTGPIPRLAYVTDSGSNETDYYRDVLVKMKHPVTGKLQEWIRVADFYHASERIWTMAHALFGKDQEQAATAWARRMLKTLKKPCGASRVLHSAASHFHRRELSDQRVEDYLKAYRYIQSRLKYMRYSDYRAQNIPLGSGVTEAACKTVFTQRLKLSGMSWCHSGAKNVLTLRTILLSRTWGSTFHAFLEQQQTPKILTYQPNYGVRPEYPLQTAS